MQLIVTHDGHNPVKICPHSPLLRMAFKVPDHLSIYLLINLQNVLTAHDVLGGSDAVMKKTQFLLFISSHSIINTLKR